MKKLIVVIVMSMSMGCAGFGGGFRAFSSSLGTGLQNSAQANLSNNSRRACFNGYGCGYREACVRDMDFEGSTAHCVSRGGQ